MSSFGTTVPERLNPSVIRQQQSQLSLLQGLRVALPCKVISFDASKQTVTVQPILTEVVRLEAGISTIPLDLLTDVPVVMPRAGAFVLTFPIQPDDECLVVFADVCIDAWWQSGSATLQQQMEKRTHDLSDGIAIFAPWSQPRVISDYSTTAAELRNENGDVRITVETDALDMAAPSITIHVTGTANVHGDTVNVTADTLVNINGSGHTTIEGKDWLTHHHSGVTTGGGVTGPVV
jgi:hypothetical protein